MALYSLPKSEKTFTVHGQLCYGLGMLVDHQETQAKPMKTCFPARKLNYNLAKELVLCGGLKGITANKHDGSFCNKGNALKFDYGNSCKTL